MIGALVSLLCLLLMTNEILTDERLLTFAITSVVFMVGINLFLVLHWRASLLSVAKVS